MLYTWNDKEYDPKLQTLGSNPIRFSLREKDKQKIEPLNIVVSWKKKTENGTINGTVNDTKDDAKNIVGDVIDFKSLIRAPVNEQGVVYLFALLSDELGFIIDSIRTGYPDCKGKRRIKENKWKEIRIEFEYESANFELHGHDSNGCDVIICWKHNWEDYPIEVISLENKIKEIKNMYKK